MSENNVKKSGKSKKVLICGIFILISGLVAFVIGMGVLDWDVFALDTTEYYNHTVLASELGFSEDLKMEKLDLSVEDWTIEITRGDEFKIDYYTTKKSTVSTGIEGSTYIFKQTEKNELFSVRMFNGLGKLKYHYKITVTDGIELNIKNKNGRIELDDIIARNVTINNSNGRIELDEVKADNIDIRNSNGRIELDGIETGNLTVKNSNSRIELDGIKADIIDIDNSNGKVIVDNTSAQALNIDNSNSRIEINNAAAEIFDIKNSNGKIIMKNVVFEKCAVKNSNAKVEIDFNGSRNEFAKISASGSNSKYRINGNKTGSINIIGDGTKELTAIGSNCSFRFNFKG